MTILTLNLVALALTGIGTFIGLANVTHPSWVARWGPPLVLMLMTGTGFLVLRDHLKTRPKRYRSEAKIIKFMHRWINNEGRVVIFSRDMSWVAPDSDIKALLLRKAGSNQLTLCLPKSIPLSEELREAGAEVNTYAELSYAPKSRFTVIRDGRLDQEVAIGRRTGDVHTIERYDPRSHPAFAMAEDLVAIIRKVSQGSS